MDKRLTPARPDLAAAFLKDRVQSAHYSEGELKRVVVADTALRRTPETTGAQETQLLFGEDFTLYEEKDGWVWGQSAGDGYVGYAEASAFAAPQHEITHRMAVLRSYVYPQASIKVAPLMLLSLNARLSVAAFEGEFARLATGGFVIARHLKTLDENDADYVSVAEQFLHTPYFWGGRTSLGIDCSGLVQMALSAAGIKAPRDADMQEQALGHHVQIDIGQVQRGDLIFWKGHVGIMQDDMMLLHANGHAMQVTREPLKTAAERIARNEYGAITAIRRLT